MVPFQVEAFVDLVAKLCWSMIGCRDIVHEFIFFLLVSDGFFETQKLSLSFRGAEDEQKGISPGESSRLESLVEKGSGL